MVLLPLPLSPTSATISRSADDEVDVVDRVQRLAGERPADLEVLGEPAGLAAAVSVMPAVAPARRPPRGRGSSAECRHRACAAADRVQLGRVGRGTASAPTGSAGWNRQPAAAGRGPAGCPGCRSAAPAARGSTGTRRAGPGCTGARACRTPSGSAPTSTTWPAYITSSWSEKWLTSDMSWVTKMTAKPELLAAVP